MPGIESPVSLRQRLPWRAGRACGTSPDRVATQPGGRTHTLICGNTRAGLTACPAANAHRRGKSDAGSHVRVSATCVLPLRVELAHQSSVLPARSELSLPQCPPLVWGLNAIPETLTVCFCRSRGLMGVGRTRTRRRDVEHIPGLLRIACEGARQWG